jgi:hypothetical protein
VGSAFSGFEGSLLVGFLESEGGSNVFTDILESGDSIVHTPDACGHLASGNVEVGKVAVEDFEGGAVVCGMGAGVDNELG